MEKIIDEYGEAIINIVIGVLLISGFWGIMTLIITNI